MTAGNNALNLNYWVFGYLVQFEHQRALELVQNKYYPKKSALYNQLLPRLTSLAHAAWAEYTSAAQCSHSGLKNWAVFQVIDLGSLTQRIQS